jgi:class 3 adenylate cyclase/tetratricopeptide (TPR) repeat protein
MNDQVMQCPSCHYQNSEAAKFCGGCGAVLPLLCPACGAPNRTAAKFCNECGALLNQQPPPAMATDHAADRVQPAALDFALGPSIEAASVPEGERKMVTALFVDIMDSTELGQNLDPEEARAIIDPALDLMIDAARRYDGYVVQSTGDGIFALFGAPVAREDHPQRSLYSAMRMQDEIRRYSARLRADGRPPIQIRAGVNTGEVVVRTIKTGAGHTEYTPIGHTVNLASRLQSLASAGSTVISDSTRTLVEGYFALRPLGPAQVKGISEPVNVHEVVGLGPLRTRLQRSAGRGLSKFVGRAKEKEALGRAAERARSGAGQIVAVVAEPGVGKSRLFFEFKAEVQSEWTVLEAFSISHGKGSAYLPIVDLLHSYFGISSEDSVHVRREKIAAKIWALDPNLENILPYLHALLEVADDKDRLSGMDAQLRKSRTLDAVARLLLAEAVDRPLLLIIEDLHWLDDESQALLDTLADMLSGSRMLLLVNYRPEYIHRWANKAWCSRIRLDSLGAGSANEMLSSILGDTPSLAPLKELIITTTGGIPFFMEETVLALFEEGALARQSGTVTLVRPLGSLRIPATVQAILAARIDRLHNDEKNLLQTLSILGREFVLSLARAVAGKSEDELERLIARLQLGEFVYEQPSIMDVEYIFKHALTQEVAYNSVLLKRRKRLHEHAGRAIETIYTGSLDDHVAELAHHFSRSDNQVKAVEYQHLAGIQAMARGALPQAIREFEQTLAMLRGFPGGVERDALELQTLSPLGTAYIVARGYAAPEVGPVFVHARELCERIGEPPQLFAVVWGNFAWRVVRGEMDLSMTLAREAIDLAERFDDPGIWMEALFLMGLTLFYRGDFRGALTQFEKALSHYDDRERTALWASHVGQNAGITHRCYLALVLWQLGYPEQALRVSQETLKLARAINHPFSLAYAQHHTSWLYHQLGLPAETQAAGEEGIQTATEHGFAMFHATGTLYKAAGVLLEGRPNEALPLLTRGLEAYRLTGAGLALPYYLSILGNAYIQADRPNDAKEVLDEGLAIAERSGELCQKSELHRLKGELLLRTGSQNGDAEDHFRRAIRMAQDQLSRAWELRATTSLARLCQQQGRRDEARQMLSDAYAWFTEGFDNPDLKAAKALLFEMDATARP